MSNNKPIDGMILPTQKGMPAGNPRDSAMQTMNNNAQLQSHANNALAGGRRRKRRVYGGGNDISVPQYQMLYEPQGGPGTNPNNQMQSGFQTSTQMAANSALDNGATKMGGSRRRRRSRKGGNPDWLWGCMSGGKKRSRKAYRKNKKSRKNKTTRKH